MGQATSFVAVYLFSVSAHAHAVSSAWLTVASLWSLLGGLEVLFVLLFTIFVLSVNKKYIATFFSTQTAKEFNIQSYREATADSTRIDIFSCHHSYYASIREDVQFWVRESYGRWNEEQPAWFTDRVKGSIPEDMLPEEEMEKNLPEDMLPKKETEKNLKKRRNSLEKIVDALNGGD